MTTDLDWLARNVHEWGERDAFYLNGTIHVGFLYDDICVISILGTSCNKYTRDQWQARRAELQNKPNWGDAPEWADALVQTDEGDWWWGKGYQSPNKMGGWDSLLKDQKHAGKGEVIGDWRYTLERRPEPKRVSKKGNAGEDFEYYVDGEISLIKNPNCRCVVTKVNKEWNGEGMPPEGTECECFSEGYTKWVNCYIFAIHGDEFWAHIDGNTTSNIYKLKSYKFRPLRTEEDNSVEEIMNVIASVSHPDESVECAIDIIAKQLYRAGYRKLDTEGGNG